MAFCGKCGSQVSEEANFCASCGAPLAAAGGAPPPSPVPPPAATAPGLGSNVIGLLVYIPFLGLVMAIVFLLIEPYKDDKLVRFHAFQSIFFSVVCIMVYWVFSAVLYSTAWGFGSFLFSLLWGAVRLAILVLWIFLMVKAYNNQRFKLPIIGEFAAKQAGLNT